MRVVIADGDELFLEILQSYFWGQGHEVEFATNGLECLAKLRECVPDMVVLDRALLWGGCEGVVAHMRSQPALANVPVVVLGRARQEFPPLNDALIVATLNKPFRIRDLLRLLAPPRREAKLFTSRVGAAL